MGQTHNLNDFLLNGLRKIEYRGYDSAGISYIDSKHDIKVFKKKGGVDELKTLLDSYEHTFSDVVCCGIGHTRWATHGVANDVNSHPHNNSKGSISIVHNGIIENYLEIKQFLVIKGYEFLSETDTEVIVHLIDYYLNIMKDTHTYLDIIRFVFSKLRGSYSCIVLNKAIPHSLVAIKNGCPLILGLIDDNNYVVSSDIISIIEHTKKVIYIKDAHIVVMDQNGYSIQSSSNDFSANKHEVTIVTKTVEDVDMSGFDSYMLKEIHEQSFSLERCMKERVFDDQIRFNELDDILDNLSTTNKITFVACGTSWHSCLMAKYYIESKARICVEVDYASEYIYRNPIIEKGDVVCAISQSGETADTIAAIELAKNRGAIIIGFVNTMESTIDNLSDYSIDLKIGSEISVASTKAFTGQILAILMLSMCLGSLKGTLPKDELMKDIQSLNNLPTLVSRTLRMCTEEIQNKMFDFHTNTSFLYLGRGQCFPIALEGALKLKEISYIHAEGYPAAEMKHGPIALIDESMPVVFIVHGSDPIYEKIISNIQEVRSRGGRLIIITNQSNNALNNLSTNIFKVPDCSLDIFPFLSVIVTQIMSYYLAKYRKCNVDKPRNLAKCVTVE